MAVVVLKSMTVVSFTEFETASTNINGEQLIANDAIKNNNHWLEANRTPSEIPAGEYHRPCWNDGTAMINKELNELRAEEYPDILYMPDGMLRVPTAPFLCFISPVEGHRFGGGRTIFLDIIYEHCELYPQRHR